MVEFNSEFPRSNIAIHEKSSATEIVFIFTDCYLHKYKMVYKAVASDLLLLSWKKIAWWMWFEILFMGAVQML